MTVTFGYICCPERILLFLLLLQINRVKSRAVQYMHNFIRETTPFAG